jgi:hypothetical protein
VAHPDAEETNVTDRVAASVQAHSELGEAGIDRRRVHVAGDREQPRGKRSPALDRGRRCSRSSAGGDVAADHEQVDGANGCHRRGHCLVAIVDVDEEGDPHGRQA